MRTQIGGVAVSPDTYQIVGSVGSQSEAKLLANRPTIQQATDIVEIKCDELVGDSPEQVVEEARDITDTLSTIGKDLPTIGVVRKQMDGGGWDSDSQSESKRSEILKKISKFVDAIDVEYEADEIYDEVVSAAKSEGVTVIVSHHDFMGTPTTEDIDNQIKSIQRKRSDIVKLAYFAESQNDMDRLKTSIINHVRTKSGNKPLIAISMGETGKQSRVDFPLLGSCLTYGFLPDGIAKAPGQYSVTELKKRINNRSSSKSSKFDNDQVSSDGAKVGR